MVADDDSEDSLYDPRFASDQESEADRSRNSAGNEREETEFTQSMEDCADVYYTLESRLREAGAFMTSKKFRLHCEIHRI